MEQGLTAKAIRLDIYKERDVLLEQGISIGEARGEAKGKAEASRDIALRLLMSGIPLEQVAVFTGLSEEEVCALRQ